MSVWGLRQFGVQGLKGLGCKGAQGMEMRMADWGAESPGRVWVLSCRPGGLVRGMGSLRGAQGGLWANGQAGPRGHDRWEGNGPWASVAGGRWYQHPNIPSASLAPPPRDTLHPIHLPRTPQTGAAPTPVPPVLAPPQHPRSALDTAMHPPVRSPPTPAMCVPLQAGTLPPQCHPGAPHGVPRARLGGARLWW